MKAKKKAPNKKRKKSSFYDIAISFAGEDRRIAEALAKALQHSGIKVFYDDFERSDLWGKDLYQHLNSIFRDRARYCVVLVSKWYLRKKWPKHELKSAQARAFGQGKEYILPILLDKSKLPGSNQTTGYADASTTPISDIVRWIGKKLNVETVDLSKSLRATWDNEFVVYQGARMTSYWPTLIKDAQKAKTLTFVIELDRIPYGKETQYGGELPKNCHDCGVRQGQLHVLSCDMEQCANCDGQLISCGCDTTDDDPALADV